MKHLPLFPTVPVGALSREAGGPEPQQRNPLCTLCPRHKHARHVCMAGTGKRGGVLVVVDEPSTNDDEADQILSQARYIKEALASSFGPEMPLAYVAAASCSDYERDPYREPIDLAHLEACRPYLANAIAVAAPKAIVAMGAAAIYAITGRKLDPITVRKGWSWHSIIDPESLSTRHIPVFYTHQHMSILSNVYLRRDFMDDLRDIANRFEDGGEFRVEDEPGLKARTYLIETREDAEVAAEELTAEVQGGKWLSLDTETSGLMDTPDFRIEMATLFAQGSLDGYTWDRKALENPDTRWALAQLLSEESVPKCGFNIKYDVRAVRSEPLLGVFNGLHSDTRIKRKLWQANAQGDLATNAELVGLGGHKDEAQEALAVICADLQRLSKESEKPAFTKTGKPRKLYEVKHRSLAADVANGVPLERIFAAIRAGTSPKAFAYRWLDPEVNARYNARDTFINGLLEDHIEAQPERAEERRYVWETISRGSVLAFAQIEANGAKLDLPGLALLEAHLRAKLAPQEKLLRDTAAQHKIANSDGEFNPSSPKQISDLLTALGVHTGRATSTGMSTDEESLSELKGKSPVVDALLEYRRLMKLLGTYVMGWKAAVRPDGRLHTSFLCDGAESGRPSSTDPNMNNVPRNSDLEGNKEGKMIRDLIIAEPGNVIVEVDESQIELRVLAMWSGDPVMVQCFVDNEDLHQKTAEILAEKVWNITIAQLEPKHRDTGKTTNFSLAYELPEKLGQLLAKKLNIPVEEGDVIATLILGRYKVLRAKMGQQLVECRKEGGAWTHFHGRRARFRPLPGLGDRKTYIRENAERSTTNTPIQGEAADQVTSALYEINSNLDRDYTVDGKRTAWVILTVYDSVFTECRFKDKEAIARMVVDCLTRHGLGPVPAKADCKWGYSWGSLDKFDPFATQRDALDF